MIGRSGWRAVAALAVLLVGISGAFAEPIEVRELTQRGWIIEGNVFCAIP